MHMETQGIGRRRGWFDHKKLEIQRARSKLERGRKSNLLVMRHAIKGNICWEKEKARQKVT